MIRCAVIGLGKMGLIRARSILADKRVLLSKCYDISENNDNLDFKIIEQKTTELENCLDPKFVDAVFVSAYVSVNLGFVKKALERGIHVFCEKPPAIELSALSQINDIYEQSNVVLKFGFNHRYHSSIQKCDELIKKNKIGRILHISGQYGKAGSIDFEKNWRNYRKYSGGGILLDQGVHLLDIIMFLLKDKCDCISALVDTLHWNIECEDNVFALIRSSKKKIPISIHSSALLWKHKFRLEIFGENGYIKLLGILSSTGSYAPETLIYGKNPNNYANNDAMGQPSETTIHYDQDKSWDLELDDFIKSIKSNQLPKHGSYTDAKNLMRLVDQIYNEGRKNDTTF
jgi:1,5-anhydro-D-fructose reductase (1,5-anhydro-D-mannitol-forming)